MKKTEMPCIHVIKLWGHKGIPLDASATQKSWRKSGSAALTKALNGESHKRQYMTPFSVFEFILLTKKWMLCWVWNPREDNKSYEIVSKDSLPLYTSYDDQTRSKPQNFIKTNQTEMIGFSVKERPGQKERQSHLRLVAVCI